MLTKHLNEMKNNFFSGEPRQKRESPPAPFPSTAYSCAYQHRALMHASSFFSKNQLLMLTESHTLLTHETSFSQAK
jgi:hypothetical protein